MSCLGQYSHLCIFLCYLESGWHQGAYAILLELGITVFLGRVEKDEEWDNDGLTMFVFL